MSALKNKAMYPGCVDDPVDHKMSESGVIFLGLFKMASRFLLVN